MSARLPLLDHALADPSFGDCEEDEDDCRVSSEMRNGPKARSVARHGLQEVLDSVLAENGIPLRRISSRQLGRPSSRSQAASSSASGPKRDQVPGMEGSQEATRACRFTSWSCFDHDHSRCGTLFLQAVKARSRRHDVAPPQLEDQLPHSPRELEPRQVGLHLLASSSGDIMHRQPFTLLVSIPEADSDSGMEGVKRRGALGE